MKNSKKCPKCNSDDVIRVRGSSRGYGAGNNIMVGMTIFSAVNVNRYICGNCGYCEEWIDEWDIPKIKQSKNPKG